VLAGGGAKGAYAFGCLKAFKERNVRFLAVSGTSVGALNAVLWSTDNMERGEAIWRDLSYSSTYPVKMLDSNRHSRQFLFTFGAAYVVLRLLWEALNGVVIHLSLPFLVCLAVLSFVPLAYAIMLWHPIVDTKFSSAALMFGAYGLQIALYYGVRNQVGTTIRSIFLFLVMAGGGLAVAFPVWHALGSQSGWKGLPAFIVGFGLSYAVVELGYRALLRVFAPNVAYMEQAPLAKTLRDLLAARGAISCPTFATTSSIEDAFDPDNPSYRTPASVGPPSPCSPREARAFQVWKPHYHQVDRLSSTELADLCLASAALPFGIVAPVRIGRVDHVDGGVADNVPIFPLVAQELDEVYVVLLEHFNDDEVAKAKNNLTLQGWMRIDRLLRVLDRGVPSGDWTLEELPYQFENPPKHVPIRIPDHFPKIQIIRPTKSLGNFVTGTLNFDGKYAREIMHTGYEDACKKLDELGFRSLDCPCK
jgi:predicted patatin/cPLA2 family phospholipase